MMVCVHAAVGAAVGSAVGKPGAPSLAAGALSHLLCDLVPHRDYELKVEAPLAFLMLGGVAWRFGLRSPQFWGAAGAVLPDGENALAVLGLLREDRTVFPSHNKSAPWFLGHGRRVESPLPQAALAAACLWLAGGGQ